MTDYTDAELQRIERAAEILGCEPEDLSQVQLNNILRGGRMDHIDGTLAEALHGGE